MEAPKITSDTILDWARQQVESKNMPSREVWLDIAFRLNLLKMEDTQLLNKMRQAVAQNKFAIMKAQDKRNVAAVDLEIETTDDFRFMKDQEAKIEVVEEFVRIAKRNSDTAF
jgi:hypothetical protein